MLVAIFYSQRNTGNKLADRKIFTTFYLVVQPTSFVCSLLFVLCNHYRFHCLDYPNAGLSTVTLLCGFRYGFAA